MDINEKAYQADFVGFKVEYDDNGAVKSAEPYLAMEDGPYYDREEIMMQSVLTGEQRSVSLDEIDYPTNIPTFYWSLTERAGVSEHRVSNMMFGDIPINAYPEVVREQINEACKSHVEYIKDVLESSFEDEYESETEHVLETKDDTVETMNTESKPRELPDIPVSSASDEKIMDII